MAAVLGTVTARKLNEPWGDHTDLQRGCSLFEETLRKMR